MEKFLFLAETQTNAAIIVINLLFVFALELAIALVYRKTHRALSYSQSFVGTIILMGVIASLIMMVVTENIVGAFALLGAFSLIRFRTIVKETRDIAFVFFALAVGVAVGTSNYTVAVAGTLVISSIILFLHRFNFASAARGGYIVVLDAREPFRPEQKSPWHAFVKKQHVLNIKTLAGAAREFTLGVQFHETAHISEAIDVLRHSEGVESVELMSGKDAVEY